MGDVASSSPDERDSTGRLAPEVFAGLGALARVSRALVGTGSLSELAKRALEEMRDALDLHLATLYVAAPDGGPALVRFVSSAAAGTDLTARDELRYGAEAWRLAVASGMPVVLREPAGWLGPNPFNPPAHDWLVMPLVSGRRDTVGVVAAAARAPIALNP
jgi:GAF domain-containing protein